MQKPARSKGVACERILSFGTRVRQRFALFSLSNAKAARITAGMPIYPSARHFNASTAGKAPFLSVKRVCAGTAAFLTRKAVFLLVKPFSDEFPTLPPV